MQTADSSTETATPRRDRWRSYLVTLIVGSLLSFLAMAALIVAVDPWKALPAALPIERLVSSDNQRQLYPMLLRTRSFDSFVFGSSTGMLIDPDRLNEGLGGRFINLSLTDGHAWEQLELLRLVLSRNPEPRTLLFTIDWVWCVPDLTRTETQIRRFPLWIYRDVSWSNLWRVLNVEALSHSVRTLRYFVGNYRPTIRANGYWAFTPREASYNLETARTKIYGQGPRAPQPPVVPPEVVSDADRSAWSFPALDRLDGMLARLPAATRVLFVSMPVHAAVQPRAGSIEHQREAVCKQAIARVAASRNSTLIDFRIPSEVTRADENYWDPLHYRVSIARRLEQSIAAAAASGQSDPDGFWRVIDAR
jgi:hypothetical protein